MAWEVCDECGEGFDTDLEGHTVGMKDLCRDCANDQFDNHDGFYGFCQSCGDARPDPEVTESTGDQICRDCFEALKDESNICQVCGTESDYYFLDSGESYCANCADGRL